MSERPRFIMPEGSGGQGPETPRPTTSTPTIDRETIKLETQGRVAEAREALKLENEVFNEMGVDEAERARLTRFLNGTQENRRYVPRNPSEESEAEGYLRRGQLGHDPHALLQHILNTPEKIAEVLSDPDLPGPIRQTVSALLREDLSRSERRGPPPRIDHAGADDIVDPNIREHLKNAQSTHHELQMAASHLKDKQLSGYVDNVVEGYLRRLEEDDANLKDQWGNIQQLMNTINEISQMPLDMRRGFVEKLKARSQLDAAAFMAKYVSAGALSEYVDGFNPNHLEHLLNTTGVSAAIDVLETKDKFGIKGAYYRVPELELQKDANGKDVVPRDLDLLRFREGDELKSYKELGEIHADQATKDEKQKAARKEMFTVNLKLTLLDRLQAAKLEKAKPKDQQNKKVIDAAGNFNIRNLDLVLGENFQGKDNKALIAVALKKLSETIQEVNKTPAVVVEEILKDSANNPELAKQIRETGLTEANKKDFEDFLYEFNRAFSIAEKMHHWTLQSVAWTGPLWKSDIKKEEWDKLPEELKFGNQAGALIQVNPVVYWPDPRSEEDTETHKKPNEKINVRTAALIDDDINDYKEFPDLNSLGPQARSQQEEKRRQKLAEIQAFDPHITSFEDAQKIKRAFENMKIEKAHAISFAWNLAYRRLYQDDAAWELINKKDSLGGKGARKSRPAIALPVALEKSTEANPGKAKFLRRYSFVGINDLVTTLAAKDVKEVIKKWKDNIPKYGPYANRLKSGDEARGVIQGVLNDEHLLANGSDAIKKIKEQFSKYMSPAPDEVDQRELDTAIKDWTRGIALYQREHINKDFGVANADDLRTDLLLMNAMAHGYISHHDRQELAREIMGPDVWRFMTINKSQFSMIKGLSNWFEQFLKDIMPKF